MKTLPWSRHEAIAHLRRDIWRYVTQAATTDDDVVLFAAALLQMPAGEVRYLAQLQFILSEEVGRLLAQMPLLVRRLTTTTASELVVGAERIGGAIRWAETFSQRGVTGTLCVFVTAPSRRAFDTPENEVLVFALHAVMEFGKRTGWDTSKTEGPADLIRARVADATRWLQARSLAEIPRRQAPSAKTLSRVRASRSRHRYQAALDVVDLYQRYIARLDRGAIREAVEQRALVARRDSVLLELRCAFHTMGTLRQLGWHAPPKGLLRPPLIYRGQRGQETVELFYQGVPGKLSVGSRYRGIQNAHDFDAVGGLIPDLAIRVTSQSGERWLLIEVKGGPKRSVEDSARAAVLDLFAYRRAFGSVLGLQRGTYGIGYAWGAELYPAQGSEILLCTPDTLPEALAALG